MESKDYNLFNKKIFVTGASGFVGSYLAEHLLGCGAKVSVLVRPDEPMENIQNIEDKLDNIFIKNIGDRDAIDKILNGVKPDVVYHLAAIRSVSYSKENPAEVFDVNVGGTLNLLEAARKSDAGKFIYISSAEIYESSDVPIKEDGVINLTSPYAASKFAAEALVMSYFSAYGLPVIIFRPSNIYGPKNVGNVIYKFTRAALRNENLLLDNGGKQIKNFVYIADFIRALLLAGEKNLAGEVFNIGAADAVTIKELALKIVALADSKSPIVMRGDREIKNKNLLCNFEKAKRLLGWSPWVNLSEGLKETIHYDKQ